MTSVLARSGPVPIESSQNPKPPTPNPQQAKKKAALCMLRLLRKYPEGFGEDGVTLNFDLI